MRNLWAAILAAALLPLAGMAARAPRVHVVPFAPATAHVRVHRSKDAAGAPFAEMVRAVRPSVAINGTYYGTDGRPLGLLRSGGRWLYRGGHMRTAFVIDTKGRASLVSRDAVRRDPARFPFAVAAGPRLLEDGRVVLDPESEGFRRAARRLRASRVALGIRKDGTGLVIVDEDAVTLSEFADACRAAGASEAVNLDGGGATALYQDGRTVVSPRIPMANIITIGE